jgi:hypothetical protein
MKNSLLFFPVLRSFKDSCRAATTVVDVITGLSMDIRPQLGGLRTILPLIFILNMLGPVVHSPIIISQWGS